MLTPLSSFAHNLWTRGGIRWLKSALTPVRIGVRELRGNLTRYLREVRQGKSILVTSHDIVIAEIRAPSPQLRPQRKPGALRGKISMADDFDLLPDDVLTAMET